MPSASGLDGSCGPATGRFEAKLRLVGVVLGRSKPNCQDRRARRPTILRQ